MISTKNNSPLICMEFRVHVMVFYNLEIESILRKSTYLNVRDDSISLGCLCITVCVTRWTTLLQIHPTYLMARFVFTTPIC